jgi:hypothetical protein
MLVSRKPPIGPGLLSLFAKPIRSLLLHPKLRLLTQRFG